MPLSSRDERYRRDAVKTLLERSSQVEEILFGARREVLTCLLDHVHLAIGFCEQALGLIGIFRTEG